MEQEKRTFSFTINTEARTNKNKARNHVVTVTVKNKQTKTYESRYGRLLTAIYLTAF